MKVDVYAYNISAAYSNKYDYSKSFSEGSKLQRLIFIIF